VSIIPNPAPTHPAWCDHTECAALDDVNVIHRSTPFRIHGGDVSLSIGLGRLDGVGDLGFIGRDGVRLRLLDLESTHEDGSDVETAANLDATQARLLAAALQCAADQLAEAVGW
jgi:hypothetical protein